MLPSPGEMEDMDGAVGALAVTTTVRVTGAAAANVTSPGCAAVTWQDPTVSGVRTPPDEMAHTDEPLAIDQVSVNPLLEWAVNANNDVSMPTGAGAGKVMVCEFFPTSIV